MNQDILSQHQAELDSIESQKTEIEVVKNQNPLCSIMEGFGNQQYTEEEILQAGYAKAKKIFSFF